MYKRQAQNKAISNNLEKVYSSVSIIGGTHFDGWYWSSTEDGAGKDTPKVFAPVSYTHLNAYLNYLMD